MIYRYDFPDQFAGLEQTDFSRYSGKLVLWGAGKIGSVVAHVLKQNGIQALAFVDISPAKQGAKYCGLDIISPETFLSDFKDAVLMITTVGREDVISWLTEKNFTNWHDAWPLLLEFDFGDYNEQNQMYMTRMITYYFRTVARSLGLKRKYVVNRLRVMITSRCSLRCKECTTFIPYVQNPQDDDWQSIVSDIKLFLDAVKGVQEIEFWGGEPLLHPDLSKILLALTDESRIEQISVITNGTICPNESLIKSLKANSRIIFRMSDYGRLSTKIEETAQLLKKNHIRYEVIDYKNWYKNSCITELHESDAELRKKFNRCMEGCGMAAWRGRLHFCATLPFLIEAGAFPEAEDNFFDLRNSTLDSQQLINSIYQYANRCNTDCYVDACRYCTGKTTTNFEQAIPVAEQVQGVLKLPKIVVTQKN